MKAFSGSYIWGLAAAASIVLVAGSAIAHHSFAAYDMSRVRTADGSIREFRWGAPHSSMVLTYVEKGKPKDMSIISGSPLTFSKQGFRPRDFKRGDRVRVVYHPNISGQPGGAMASMKLPDGQTFSDSEAARAGAN